MRSTSIETRQLRIKVIPFLWNSHFSRSNYRARISKTITLGGNINCYWIGKNSNQESFLQRGLDPGYQRFNQCSMLVLVGKHQNRKAEKNKTFHSDAKDSFIKSTGKVLYHV